MNKMVQKTFSYIKWVFRYPFEFGFDFGYFGIGVKFVSVFLYLDRIRVFVICVQVIQIGFGYLNYFKKIRRNEHGS